MPAPWWTPNDGEAGIGSASRYGERTLIQRHGQAAYLALACNKYLHDRDPSLSAPAAAETSRGLETLGLRLDRHGANALAVAGFLDAHPAIARVHQPGLRAETAAVRARSSPSSPSTRRPPARRWASSSTACPGSNWWPIGASTIRLSIGLEDPEDLIADPGPVPRRRRAGELKITHGSVRDTPLVAPTDLARLSVGVEDARDLSGGLEQALATVASLRLSVGAV